ncbi:hypothetical protein C4552_01765 [Candidatus Parcubacteria bacterium]|nr:MAG: hypothetical protein C4552_01765 [Candidatus Parcubacteria bacterium]
MLTNRWFILVVALLAVALVGAAVFFMLGRGDGETVSGDGFFGNLPFLGGDSGTPPPPPPVSGNGNGFFENGDPNANLRPLIQIIDRPVLGPVLAKGADGLLYIDPQNGHVLTTDLLGDNEQSIVSITVPEPFDARWAPDRSRVVIFSHDAGIVKKFLAGVATGTLSKFLPPEITAIDWAPDSKQIAYLTRRASDSALTVADAANQKPAVVWTTPIPDLTVAWLSRNTILLPSRPSGLAPSVVFSFNPATKAVAQLVQGVNGAVLQPLAGGTAFLLSAADQRGNATPVTRYTLAGGTAAALGVTTIAEKCASSADQKKIWCGVPRDAIPAPSPDTWYQRAAGIHDRIVEIDVASGRVTTLLDGNPDLDVAALFATPDSRYLFIHDWRSGTVWRLDLLPATQSDEPAATTTPAS